MYSFPNLFLHETLQFSGISSTNHQEFSTSSILILQASCRQNCVTYASAKCKVANSWWWFLVIVQIEAQIIFKVFIYLFIVLYIFLLLHRAFW